MNVTNTRFSVSHNLRTRRLLAGMNQTEFSQKCGCSRNTISSIETGQYLCTVGLALKFAEVLGVHVEDIFTLDYDTEE